MKITSLALTIILALVMPVFAQQASADAEVEEENELNVTAERMEVLLDGKTIELTTNVRFEDSTMILTADRMLILLDEDKDEKADVKADENKKASSIPGSDDNANMKLKRLDAYGNVVLRKKLDATESAMGDNASYDVKTDCVMLTGNCLITQGDRSMRGNEVIFDRTHQKINVKQASIRIKLPKNGKSKDGLGSLIGTKKSSEKKTEE